MSICKLGKQDVFEITLENPLNPVASSYITSQINMFLLEYEANSLVCTTGMPTTQAE